MGERSPSLFAPNMFPKAWREMAIEQVLEEKRKEAEAKAEAPQATAEEPIKLIIVDFSEPQATTREHIVAPLVPEKKHSFKTVFQKLTRQSR